MLHCYRLDPNRLRLHMDDDYKDLLFKINLINKMINDIIERHPDDKNIQYNLTKTWKKDIIELYELKDLYDIESIASLNKFLPKELVLYIKKFL